ncbi:hypothetical protein BRARA_E02467 [Brassica rapa]|uniref:Uncharacterized protein n=1 Tax=Brassica campestris TaxID=3711 RepID=A0A397ZDC6_BRACM|nr:hypothetical protein BRARA_E02467 [Brassica rapa]
MEICMFIDNGNYIISLFNNERRLNIIYKHVYVTIKNLSPHYYHVKISLCLNNNASRASPRNYHLRRIRSHILHRIRFHSLIHFHGYHHHHRLLLLLLLHRHLLRLYHHHSHIQSHFHNLTRIRNLRYLLHRHRHHLCRLLHPHHHRFLLQTRNHYRTHTLNRSHSLNLILLLLLHHHHHHHHHHRRHLLHHCLPRIPNHNQNLNQRLYRELLVI